MFTSIHSNSSFCFHRAESKSHPEVLLCRHHPFVHLHVTLNKNYITARKYKSRIHLTPNTKPCNRWDLSHEKYIAVQTAKIVQCANFWLTFSLFFLSRLSIFNSFHTEITLLIILPSNVTDFNNKRMNSVLYWQKANIYGERERQKNWLGFDEVNGTFSEYC